jgi:hypothetical protein
VADSLACWPPNHPDETACWCRAISGLRAGRGAKRRRLDYVEMLRSTAPPGRRLAPWRPLRCPPGGPQSRASRPRLTQPGGEEREVQEARARIDQAAEPLRKCRQVE